MEKRRRHDVRQHHPLHDARGEQCGSDAEGLALQVLKKRRHRREGGEGVQESKSTQNGKYWEDARRGWLDPVETRNVRKHVIDVNVIMKTWWEETRRSPYQDGLVRHKQGERQSVQT